MRKLLLITLSVLTYTTAYAQNISTVAGNGIYGSGGDGSAATFASFKPTGVAVDGSGNIYIADYGDNRIRKVTLSTGIISTVAGNGTKGYGGDGSAATSANLNNPSGIAVDGSGNIYIADFGNHRIRKVTASTGIISTIAGKGAGYYFGDGGAATYAYLNGPTGVAVDGSGNIYIADYYNNRIRKITASTGIISTVAGIGPPISYGGDGSAATSANLNSPIGVAVDGSGNIYIADFYNMRIRKVTASTGIITTVAGNGIYGSGGDGSAATSANLIYPSGVAVDGSGNIYIADYQNSKIRKVTASNGIISTVAGNGNAGYGGDGSAATSATLNDPSGVAVDGLGNIYIADEGNYRIRKVKNNIISSSQTICAGSAPAILTGNTPIGSTSNTYTWLSSTTSASVGFTAIPSTNTINYSPGVLTQNTWFRRYVVSGTFTDTSEAIAITVDTIPTAPSTPTRVSKTATSINVTWGAVSGATGYKLDVSTNSGFTALVSGYSNTSVTGTSTTITGLTGSTTYYVRVRAVNATSCNSVSSSVLTETTPANTVSLTLRAYLQGLYAGGKMISAPFNADGTSPQNIADTITVKLRANTTPYNVIHTVKGLLDTSGNATITFPGSVNGNSYYVVVGHRNSVAVWSANPVAFSTNTNYDFTNAATKAFGSNMAEDGGVFMLFNGDINQDGSIDFADYPDLEISSRNGDLGYLPYDLNGDASVDFADYPLIDINSSNGIIILTP